MLNIKSIMSIFFIGLYFVSAHANAAGNTSPKRDYVLGAVGFVVPNSVDDTSDGTTFTGNYENGSSFSGALGYRVNKYLRLEAEISYAMVGFESLDFNGGSVDLDGDLDFISYTANAFFDIPIKSRFTPYFGVGAGIATYESGIVTGTVNGTTITVPAVSDSALTAFGEVGGSFALSDRVDIVPSYRYQWVNDGDSTTDADTQHIFKVGIRFAF